MKERFYIAIDLKSFYASIECCERGLNPLDTNLIVADESRTDKTICLAVTPSLKSYGIPGRIRLFELKRIVEQVNAARKFVAPKHKFTGYSHIHSELIKDPSLGIDFLIAPPRMAYYMHYSAKIYSIYLKYIAPEDIVVYSIDEVFMDVTNYLGIYKMTPRELAAKIIEDVFDNTGITATAGIGTNLYLCKIAMDIVAKHMPADKNGVRIAELDESEYRSKLWAHEPLTDFWHVGRGYAKKLNDHGLFTMGDIARCSVWNEELFYNLFGKNAELLIDHAWGYEPCTIKAIKAYKPSSSSLSSGQVLQCPYSFDKAKLVLMEMIDSLALSLVEKGLVTNQIVITIGYDVENLIISGRKEDYKGEVIKDRYGREVPKYSHGTGTFERYNSSAVLMMKKAGTIYDEIVDKHFTIRRLNVAVQNLVLRGKEPINKTEYEQLDFFTDYELKAKEQNTEEIELEREYSIQQATLAIKKKYGKNALLKGMNYEPGATQKSRNEQVGGHKA